MTIQPHELTAEELRQAVEAQPGADRWSTDAVMQAIQSED